MRNFLRLEADDKYGIYTTGNLEVYHGVRELIDAEYGSLTTPRHPTPSSDSLLWRKMEKLGLNDSDIRYGVRYGFSSESQFRAWFPSDEMLEKFSDLGVKIVLYKAPFVIDGNAQAVIPGKDFGHTTLEVFRMSLQEYLERKRQGTLTIEENEV
jgi:hypothetical protein